MTEKETLLFVSQNSAGMLDRKDLAGILLRIAVPAAAPLSEGLLLYTNIAQLGFNKLAEETLEPTSSYT